MLAGPGSAEDNAHALQSGSDLLDLNTLAKHLYDDAKCFRTLRSHNDCALLQDDNEKLAGALCTVTRKHNPIITSDTAIFSDHINAQVNKANKMLGFIRRTISGSKILLPSLRSLYVTLVRSQLEYAFETWSPKSVTMIKRIEGVQRRVTRLL